MRRIVKGPEPESLVQHRSTPGADWNGYADKAGARAALCRQQGYLCCYCLRRISVKEARPDELRGTKIEHFKPREGKNAESAQELKWSNLFGACVGTVDGEPGHSRAEQHCDTRKGEDLLDMRLNPRELQDGLIHYLANGQVSCAVSELQAELGLPLSAEPPIQGGVLNLNIPYLVRNRRDLYESFLAHDLPKLSTDGDLKKAYERYTQPDANGKLPEYCEVIAQLLAKKLRQREAVPSAVRTGKKSN